MCVYFSTSVCETFLVLRIIQRDDIVTHIHACSCKVPVIIVDFSKTGIFSRFRKKLQYQFSSKSAQ